jgi:predicted DCC family thiol-disulfide oxidoreductase YuxK
MNIPAAIVFFDGGCALCRREIDHYRRRRGADRLLWIDITQDDVMLSAHGLRKEQAMARFHVRDASGFWQTGAWGFVELWSHLPAYRWLASLLRTLRLVGLLDRFYSRFARWRLRRRCNPQSCLTGPPPEKRRDGRADERRTRA